MGRARFGGQVITRRLRTTIIIIIITEGEKFDDGGRDRRQLSADRHLTVPGISRHPPGIHAGTISGSSHKSKATAAKACQETKIQDTKVPGTKVHSTYKVSLCTCREPVACERCGCDDAPQQRANPRPARAHSDLLLGHAKIGSDSEPDDG